MHIDENGLGKLNRNAFPLHPEYADGWNDAIKNLEYIPTADVVPVVRCRECKQCERFKEERENGNFYYYCNVWDCALDEDEFDGDGFCKWGERRDDVDLH